MFADVSKNFKGVRHCIFCIVSVQTTRCLNQVKSAEEKDAGSTPAKQAGFICLPINSTRTNLQYLSTQRPTTLFDPNKTASGLERTEDLLRHRYNESMQPLTKKSVCPRGPGERAPPLVAVAIAIIHSWTGIQYVLSLFIMRRRDDDHGSPNKHPDEITSSPASGCLSSINQDEAVFTLWT